MIKMKKYKGNYNNRWQILKHEEPITSQKGGSNDPYYQKYLKYKNKYLQLKKELNQ